MNHLLRKKNRNAEFSSGFQAIAKGMKSRALRWLCAGLILCEAIVMPASASGVPQLGVYDGNDPAGLDAYGAWLNHPDVWGETGIGFNAGWAPIDSPASALDPYITWVKTQPARRLFITVPMFPGYTGNPGGPDPTITPALTLVAGASGTYNSHFVNVAKYLVDKGVISQVIIRIGHEYNGNWYPWRAAPNPTAWKGYYQQIVTAMRGFSDANGSAATLKFCFNPATSAQELSDPTSVYPGDSYVDYIALDTYDECFAANTYPYGAPLSDATRQANAWAIYLGTATTGYGIAQWYSFARTHNKPFGFAEWGVSDASYGGQDNPYFIGQMYNFMNIRPIAFACYFEYPAGGSHHQLHSSIADYFPNSAANFLRLFGSTLIIDDVTNVADAGAVTVTGSWTSSTGAPGYYNSDYLHDGDTGQGTKSVKFTPTIQTGSDGNYNVFAWWVSAANRASNTPIDVLASGTVYPLSANQRTSGSQWNWLGTYPLASGTGGNVTISNTAANGYVVADAVEFVRTIPKPWINEDLGSVGVTGSTTCSNGVFTVNGSGTDIGGTVDAFQFVHQSASGDCDITARVASQTNPNSSEKAGVMIRESLAINSSHVHLFITPGNGLNFEYRGTTGGTTTSAAAVAGTAPTWLRLKRVGSVFTAYKSTDNVLYQENVTWTQVGSPVTISMASNVTLGLTQCSHNNMTLGTAVFDNVVANP